MTARTLLCFWGNQMRSKALKRIPSEIPSDDVVGYNPLLSEGEYFSLSTLSDHPETVAILIRERKGRAVDSTGDSLLAVFSGVT